jgi:hypothetical protein
VADGPTDSGAGGDSPAPQTFRDVLRDIQRQCERQTEILRLRGEWLQAARGRLWERMDRMQQARIRPAAEADPAMVAADVGVPELEPDGPETG